MNTKLLTLAAIVLTIAAGAFQAQAASDNFESGLFPAGGSGWATNWTQNSTFLGTNSQIDGTNTLGEFGSGASSQRTFAPITSGQVIATWSFKSLTALSNGGNEIGFSIMSGNTAVLSFKFVNGNSNLLINDGGTDFNPTQPSGGLSFVVGDIYDFTATLNVGSTLYSFTATDRNTGAFVQGVNYGLNAGNSTSPSIDGVRFFASLPSGGGNDAHLDNVTVVPEPATYASALLCGVTIVGAGIRRRFKKTGPNGKA